ncbi:MAG TPA: hypothetical protein VGI82_12690 [Chitinophagaceae bacterium]|jgi:hypothetical protein
MKRMSRPGKILFFVFLGIIAVLFFGEVVMLLWNNVLAAVTNVHDITFWQALGLLLLSKILFGGGFSGGWGSRRPYWKQRMQQKWNNMTPEEREKFKQEWQKRCGTWGYKSWESDTQNAESAKENPTPGM